MCIAYQYVRIRPKGSLRQQLLSCSDQQELRYAAKREVKPDTRAVDGEAQSKVLMTASKQHNDGSRDIGVHALSLAELGMKERELR